MLDRGQTFEAMLLRISCHRASYCFPGMTLGGSCQRACRMAQQYCLFSVEKTCAVIMHNHGYRLTFVRVRQGKIQQARDMYQHLLQSKERLKGSDSVELCPLLLLMAALEKNHAKDYAQAEALLKRALAIKLRQYNR